MSGAAEVVHAVPFATAARIAAVNERALRRAIDGRKVRTTVRDGVSLQSLLRWVGR